uniref:hypothetical protein n=1 Tax=Psychrobacter sp. TaxID=56811 RepID=UPI0015EF3922|nr:hypothetical protein [Psychrobacter sp.]
MKIFTLALVSMFAMLTACSPADEATSYETSTPETIEESGEGNKEAAYEEASIGEETNEVAYVEPSAEAYSQEKINFCDDAEDKNACNCQFDVMDPILTAAIGSDWSTKSMEEKDFPTYVSAVEASVAQCP